MENAILITGASKRLGFYVAKKLIEEGYFIIAHFRTKSEELEELDTKKSFLVHSDFNDLESIKNMVCQIKEKTTSLRGIIHNASYFEPTSEIFDEIIEQYNIFFHVHMLSPYIINELLFPLLINTKSNYADIINITDIYTNRPNPKFDIYSSTKAGLSNLTKSLAKKYSPKIKVNEIAPGPILFKNHSQNDIDEILSNTLLKQEGGLEPLFIAIKSILDNNYMTGSQITVDGGRTLAE